MEVTGKDFEPYGPAYQPLRSDPGTDSHQLDVMSLMTVL